MASVLMFFVPLQHVLWPQKNISITTKKMTLPPLVFPGQADIGLFYWSDSTRKTQIVKEGKVNQCIPGQCRPLQAMKM